VTRWFLTAHGNRSHRGLVWSWANRNGFSGTGITGRSLAVVDPVLPPWRRYTVRRPS